MLIISAIAAAILVLVWVFNTGYHIGCKKNAEEIDAMKHEIVDLNQTIELLRGFNLALSMELTASGSNPMRVFTNGRSDYVH